MIYQPRRIGTEIDRQIRAARPSFSGSLLSMPCSRPQTPFYRLPVLEASATAERAVLLVYAHSKDRLIVVLLGHNCYGRQRRVVMKHQEVTGTNWQTKG